MKKLLLLMAIVSVGLASCKKKGCIDPTAVNYNSEAKKDDGSCNYTPTIVLNGAATVTLNVGDTYSDLGATATNEDGSSAAVTVDESDVNASLVGTYTVTYSASNTHGTSTATRTVNVVIGQDNWLGSPALTTSCDALQFPLAAAPVVTAGGTATTIVIDNMFNLVGGTVTGTINGATLTIPQQTVNITLGEIILSGTGTMNASGTAFTIDFNYENTTPIIGGTGSCSADYAL